MGLFEDSVYHDSGFSLASALDWAETDYRDDFKDRWGFEADEPPEGMESDEWIQARQLYGLANQIASAAATLLARKGLGQGRLSLPAQLKDEASRVQGRIDELLRQVRDERGMSAWWQFYEALLPMSLQDPRTRFNILKGSLQLQAAEMFPYYPDRIADRLLVLATFLVRYQNERTTAYLGRVAQCYALDMPAEFAVMSRAVLDSAFQHIVDDTAVRDRVGGGPEIGLERRIAYFESMELLPGEEVAAARRVKRAGDEAIHTAPGLEPKMESVLTDLVQVLTKLDRLVPRRSSPIE